jgi:hypothetical protein
MDNEIEEMEVKMKKIKTDFDKQSYDILIKMRKAEKEKDFAFEQGIQLILKSFFSAS